VWEVGQPSSAWDASGNVTPQNSKEFPSPRLRPSLRAKHSAARAQPRTHVLHTPTLLLIKKQAHLNLPHMLNSRSQLSITDTGTTTRMG
jgi:hypothetical protein